MMFKKFNCHLVDDITGERKTVEVDLEDFESNEVTRVLAQQGPEAAELIASAYALRHAYGKVDPGRWLHVVPPEHIHPN